MRLMRFQSHNGAIAAEDSLDFTGLFPGFNPTMVRLLPSGCVNLKRQPLSFNPTMVRLLQTSA